MHQIPAIILSEFNLAGPVEYTALGNHGGFSGALLWRVARGHDVWCLRAYPAQSITRERLTGIHGLMHQARQAGLAFVPHVISTRGGDTWSEGRGRLWDLSTWLPGQADFWAHPTPARLDAACRALAQLHEAWRPARRFTKPCPGWVRRREKAVEWRELLRQGWRPQLAPLDPIAEVVPPAWNMLTRRTPWLIEQFLQQPVPLVPVQPCLCDPWHDHVLFTEDQVTGLIDYGSVKEDHVAVDLARLLGSFVEDDEEAWNRGLATYQQIRPVSSAEIALARLLDRTGVVMAATTWLRWLLVDNRQFPQRQAIAARLGKLVQRMEKWS